MKSTAPAADFPPDPDQHFDETKPSKRRRTSRPKATFQWPPDCLWPFMDDEGWDTET